MRWVVGAVVAALVALIVLWVVLVMRASQECEDRGGSYDVIGYTYVNTGKTIVSSPVYECTGVLS